MSVTRATMATKVRARSGDETTRRDGSAISTPRFSDAKVQQAINDAVRDRQPLIETLDRTWYMSVLDFVGQTDAIASSSSTTLPIVANEQYPAPSNMKRSVRLARRDLPNFPTVRQVSYEQQDQIAYVRAGWWAGFGASYPESLSPSDETWSLVTNNAAGTLSNRIRIKPAPAATTYTYRFWFLRTPTEPGADGHTLDVPPDWIEVIALDAAIILLGYTDDLTIRTLVPLRDVALQARMEDFHGRSAGPAQFGNVRM